MSDVTKPSEQQSIEKSVKKSWWMRPEVFHIGVHVLRMAYWAIRIWTFFFPH